MTLNITVQGQITLMTKSERDTLSLTYSDEQKQLEIFRIDLTNTVLLLLCFYCFFNLILLIETACTISLNSCPVTDGVGCRMSWFLLVCRWSWGGDVVLVCLLALTIAAVPSLWLSRLDTPVFYCMSLHFGFLIRCFSVPVCATCVILLFTFESFGIITNVT